jgi:hypothetical protein
VERGKGVDDLNLTPARREKIEQAIPEAKGFLAVADLEGALKALKLDDDKKALAELDKRAAGKWVLFAGNANNPGVEKLSMAVIYKDKPKDNPFRYEQWVLVHVEKIKGFLREGYAIGQNAVILAKYLGQRKASPGYDVASLGHW